MQNTGLDKPQAEIKLAGRNINNLRYTDDTTLMAESKEELKNLLIRVKEEREKYVLKLNIKKTEIMAFLVAQTVKNSPARQETWVWSLGQEHPLEKGMATHSSILA